MMGQVIAKITDQLVATLRGLSAQAEMQGRLTDKQLSIVYDQKWFKLFVPRQFGGLELTLPDGVRLEEELAWIDGSLGWTVTLCSGANLFVGYMDVAVTPAMFSSCDVCLGGSGQASGKAIVENGGYVVNGQWRYATGAPHNTFFTANCVIEQDGKLLMDDQGNPTVRSFFFAHNDVQIIEDWNAFGLKATASHSFSVNELWVDQSHAFVIAPEQATLGHPIYKYPFLQFAEATLAANTLGMARHFIDCAGAIIHEKQEISGKVVSCDVLETAKIRIQEAKSLFYQVLDESWDELVAMDAISASTLVKLSERSNLIAKLLREQVVTLYPHCGMAAANSSSTINRIWRDLFTASQHSLLR